MNRRTLVSFLLGIGVASCGGSSSAGGVWTITGAGSGSGSTITRRLTLADNGSATFAFEGGGTCSGSVTYSGFTWEDVANTGATGGRAIRFGGTSSCSGMLTCSNGSSGCAQLNIGTTGTCPYTIGAGSSGGTTLTLVNCFGTTNQTDVFTRQ